MILRANFSQTPPFSLFQGGGQWLYSKNGRAINMTTDATDTSGGSAGEEKRPAVQSLTDVGDLLQIQHLTQGHAPHGQDVFVEHVFFGTGPAFEGGGVPGHGGEVTVVEPGDDFGALLHAGPGRVFAEGEVRVGLGGARVVVFRPPAPDQEDVADFHVPPRRRRSDVQTLVPTAGGQLGVADRVWGGGVVGLVLGFGVRSVIEEH